MWTLALAAVAVVALAFIVRSCAGTGGGGAGQPVTALEVTPVQAIDEIGAERQFEATATYEDGSSGDVTDAVDWSSADEALAEAAEGGLVSAKSGGWVAIIATDPDSGVQGAATYGVKYAAEGSVGSPVSLESGVTHKGTAGTGRSYYQLTGGGNFGVTLSGMSDDMDLYVYDDDATFTTESCRPFYGRTTDETCFCVNYAGTLQVAVNGEYTELGSPFSLKVTSFPSCSSEAIPPTGYNEGTIAEPVNVPVNSAIAARVGWGTSYYRSNVTEGKRYTVNMIDAFGGNSGDVDLYVYGADSTYTTTACESATGSVIEEACSLTAPGSRLHFSVFNPNAESDEVYSLAVLGAEGSAAVPIPLFEEKYNFGQVNDRTSYYAIRVENGTAYSVIVTTLRETVTLNVYLSAGFGTPDCTRARGPTCDVTATSSWIYATVDDGGLGRGAMYTLQATRNVPAP